MRKLLCSLTLLALTFAAVGGFAATKPRVYKYVPKTTSGKPVPKGSIKFKGFDPASMAAFKAQNHLPYAMNQKIKNAGLLAKKNGYINGTLDTIPYFSSWYITGNRNSIYPFSMVGQDPSAGGTTGVNTQIIPLISVLLVGGVTVYTFDPTVAVDPQGAASVPSVGPGVDTGLFAQSPLFDATTTYPGPPPQTGQVIDTAQRTAFRATAAANWHTTFNAPYSSGVTWIQFLEYNNGDWACLFGSTPPCAAGDFPVVSIDTISNNFAFILSAEAPPNNTFPIILTDWLTAFEGIPANCCVLGYHATQPGIVDPSGPLVWTWGTYIPYAADNGLTNPFGGFGYNSMVLSHEMAETVNDPFVQAGGTSVSPWVSGGLTFAQANLEVGDVIEDMNLPDVVYPVPLTTTGGLFTYNLQNTALLEWFTRNPLNGGIYSWPSEHTLGQAPHIDGTCAGGPTWAYGQGSGGFFFCNSNTGW
jgi:hypothetical protein